MLAPIIVFAFNRPDHTRETLRALKQNLLAADSELYIYIDGPRSNSTEEQLKKIDEVKRVAGEEQWCGKVKIVSSSLNKGLAASVLNGVTEIIDKYGKVIVLEDDLVSDKYFLKFMNEALDLYEKSDEVACVTGYIYPVKGKLPETFFIKGADCWGWATWKRGWEILNTDGRKLLAEIKEKGLEHDFDFYGSYPYTQMLSDQVEGKNNSWAILWYASAYLENKLTLYPGHSLIHNTGTDGSGTHSATTDKFSVNLRQEVVNLAKMEPKEDAASKKIIADYFKDIGPEPKSGFLTKLRSLFR